MCKSHYYIKVTILVVIKMFNLNFTKLILTMGMIPATCINFDGNCLEYGISLSYGDKHNLSLIGNRKEENVTSNIINLLMPKELYNHINLVNVILAQNSQQQINEELESLQSALMNDQFEQAKLLITSIESFNEVENLEPILALFIFKYPHDNEKLALIENLLAKGIDINRPYQQSDIMALWATVITVYPLQIAVERQDLNLVKFLLDNGANVNADNEFLCDDYGNECNRVGWFKSEQNISGNALHLAVRMNNLEIVKLLLASGVDINQRDNKNKTALEIAEANQNQEIITLLRDYKLN